MIGEWQFTAAHRFVGLAAAVIGLAIAFSSLPVPPALTAVCITAKGGTIGGNETWTLAGSPYCVTSELTVAADATLTIQPGVKVQFYPGTGLDISGMLVARGTAANPITFTSNADTPAKGDWKRIYFAETSPSATFDSAGNYTGGSVLQYTILEYAGSSTDELDAAVRIDRTRPYIDHNTVRYNRTDAIKVAPAAGKTVIANNTISDNGIESVTLSNGIVISNNQLGTDEVEVRGNTINNTAYGDGIVSSASLAVIRDNTITGAYRGVGGGGGTALVIRNTIESSYWHGVQFGPSSLTLTDNTITYSRGAGILLEKEEPFYALIERNIVTHNQRGALSLGYSSPAVTVTVRRNDFSLNSGSGGSGYSSGINVHSLSWAGSGAPGIVITENNLCDSFGPDVFFSNTPDDLNAENNYWGTTDAGVIESLVFHKTDSPGLGLVDYVPFLAAPVDVSPKKVFLPLVVRN